METPRKWLVQPGESKVIEVDDIRSLKVSLVGGQVDIIGHDEPTTRVEVHSVHGRDLKVSVTGDRLEVDHPQLRWDNFIEVFRSLRMNARADVSVLVPRDVALKFGVVSADALVSGLSTDAKLSTVSGSLVVDGITGDLELNGVSGELSVRNHAGRVNAHTISGDLTASGDIPRLSVDSVSGDVMLDITGTPDALSANSVSGNFTARITEAVGARYHLNSVSGRLRFDNADIRMKGGRGYTGTTGSLDGSWVDITVNSVSGSVTIVRRDDRAPSGATPSADGTAATPQSAPSAAGTGTPTGPDADTNASGAPEPATPDPGTPEPPTPDSGAAEPGTPDWRSPNGTDDVRGGFE